MNIKTGACFRDLWSQLPKGGCLLIPPLGTQHKDSLAYLVSTLLKSSNNITHQTTLNSIWFYGQKSPFLIRSRNTVDRQGSTFDNRGFIVVLVGHDRSRSCYDGNTGEFGGNGCGGGSCSRCRCSTASYSPSSGRGGDRTSSSGEHGG